MPYQRPLSINNTLSHGVCNYACSTCGVNTEAYAGPVQFQDIGVTARLVERVGAAAAEGIRVRYLAMAGAGEPTL